MSNNIIKKTVNNNGNKIEYYVSNEVNDKSTLIISMGIWEPGSRALPLISRLTGRHCIVLSYRGRGGSDAPESGFNWNDYISDMSSVIKNEKVNNPVFLGFSKGVSYMLAFLAENLDYASGIIILDYPAIHTKQQKGAAELWYNMIYNGVKLGNFITKHTLEGIENESTYKEFYEDLNKMNCPVWLFRGTDADSQIESNLTDEDIMKYKKSVKKLEIIDFNYSGHMILDEELSKAAKNVEHILNTIDSEQSR